MSDASPTGPMGSRPSNLMGRCPQCSKPSLIAPANPWRPFCSERCKLIDLGDWMNGRFVIPVEPSADSDDYEPEELPPRQ